MTSELDFEERMEKHREQDLQSGCKKPELLLFSLFGVRNDLIGETLNPTSYRERLRVKPTSLEGFTLKKGQHILWNLQNSYFSHRCLHKQLDVWSLPLLDFLCIFLFTYTYSSIVSLLWLITRRNSCVLERDVWWIQKKEAGADRQVWQARSSNCTTRPGHRVGLQQVPLHPASPYICRSLTSVDRPVFRRRPAFKSGPILSAVIALCLHAQHFTASLRYHSSAKTGQTIDLRSCGIVWPSTLSLLHWRSTRLSLQQEFPNCIQHSKWYAAIFIKSF